MNTKANIREKILRHPEFPIVAILIAIYLFLANYFTWSVAFAYPFLNTSGGSDPYFNYFIVTYILHYHTQLIYTNAINYPAGTYNYRPPFYQWSVVFGAYVVSPFVGLGKAAYFVFEESDAIYGALLIAPVYLITKEIFGKKAGIMAALLYTIMPSNLTSGILTDGRAHTPELIFAFLAIYFFEMAIKTANKGQIINKLTDFRSYFKSIGKYYRENNLSTVYALLAAVSLGGLIVIWQGYPYIEVIILIYVAVQLIFNILTKRPTGYLTYLTTLFIAFSFPFGFYYYYSTHMLMPWFFPPLAMGLLIIGFGLLVNVVGRKPWIITIPSMILVTAAGLFILSKTNPVILKELITGDGYFVKSRLYSTIAEASAPALGGYIAGFGPGVFMLGIAGIPYLVYKWLKTRSETILSILIFAIFSIFMSFTAARFNVTAAPAYAILGGGLIMYFAELLKKGENQKKIKQNVMKRSLKTNITWLQASFVFIIILILIIPSGMGALSASVPSNTATHYNNKVRSSIPSFLRPNSTSYLGNYGLFVTNKTSYLSQSFLWLSKQNTNLPLADRPAYLSWWDYGFQEAQQGGHPAVADDFQQGYVSAGQVLLAQNQSDMISLFISRLLETPGAFSNGHFNTSVMNTLTTYFGSAEAKNITMTYENVEIKGKISSSDKVLLAESAYGNHQVNVTDPSNAYHALIMGQLSTKYSLNTIVNAYSALENVTGSSISYIQTPHALFPFAGNNTGTFYAPAYLTDTNTYTASGEVVPYNYYNIFAVTSSGAEYPLNKTPSGANIITYDISYTQAFYNSTIYKSFIGYSPSLFGQTNGLPGINYGSGASAAPAFNMSHFELAYYTSLWSPSKHPTSLNSFKPVSLQQAYKYKQENKGTSILLPPLKAVANIEDPIIQYYPGAAISGHISGYNGSLSGVHVTILDQYGIPHQVVTTNSTGYYNLTGLPGNDKIVYSTGKINNGTMEGSNIISEKNITVSKNQANRASSYKIPLGNYNITKNDVNGTVALNNLTKTYTITSGNLIFHNSTYNKTYTAKIASSGYYNIPDMRNYTYNVSIRNATYTMNGILYNDKNFTNVSTYKVPLAKNVTNNVSVNMDKLTVYPLIYRYGLSNYTVTITDKATGKSYNYKTNSSGLIRTGLMPGNYTINVTQTENNQTATNSTYYNFTTYNQSKTFYLTPAINTPTGKHNVTLLFNTTSRIPYNGTVYLIANNGTPYSGNMTSGKVTIKNVPAGVYYTGVYSKGAFIYFNKTGTIINGTNNAPISITKNVTTEKKIYNYTMYASSKEYAIANGSAYMLPIYLNNTGNAPINVNLSILNSAKLFSSDKVKAYYSNGKNVTSVTIPVKTNETVYVYLKPAKGVTLSSSLDKVQVHSNYNSKEYNQTISPQTSSISSTVGSSGTGVTNNYTKNPLDTIYIGIGITLGAILIGLVGSSIRSRKGKK